MSNSQNSPAIIFNVEKLVLVRPDICIADARFPSLYEEDQREEIEAEEGTEPGSSLSRALAKQVLALAGSEITKKLTTTTEKEEEKPVKEKQSTISSISDRFPSIIGKPSDPIL